MTRETLTEAEWRGMLAIILHQKYGYTVEFALETANAAEYLDDVEPEEAADDEFYYLLGDA